MPEEKKDKPFTEVTIRLKENEHFAQFMLILDHGVKAYGLKVVECAAEIKKQIADQVNDKQNATG